MSFEEAYQRRVARYRARLGPIEPALTLDERKALDKLLVEHGYAELARRAKVAPITLRRAIAGERLRAPHKARIKGLL